MHNARSDSVTSGAHVLDKRVWRKREWSAIHGTPTWQNMRGEPFRHFLYPRARCCVAVLTEGTHNLLPYISQSVYRVLQTTHVFSTLSERASCACFAYAHIPFVSHLLCWGGFQRSSTAHYYNANRPGGITQTMCRGVRCREKRSLSWRVDPCGPPAPSCGIICTRPVVPHRSLCVVWILPLVPGTSAEGRNGPRAMSKIMKWVRIVLCS